MKKQSIKRQMIAVFICMIVCMIGAMWITNVRFLEPYYVRNKQTEFIKMYKELRTAIKKDNITDNTVSNRIQKMAEKNNISFLVLDNRNSDSDDVSIITNVHDKDLLRKQLMGYLLNQAQKNGKVLLKKKNYQIRQTKEPWTQTEYIEMWGTFSDGETFLIRSPLERKRTAIESVSPLHRSCCAYYLCNSCMVFLKASDGACKRTGYIIREDGKSGF